MSDFVDYYELLSLPSNATNREIQRAYRQQARQIHPDKNPDKKDSSTEQFHLISVALEVLLDPSKRLSFDKKRKNLIEQKLKRQEFDKIRAKMVHDLEQKEKLADICLNKKKEQSLINDIAERNSRFLQEENLKSKRKFRKQQAEEMNYQTDDTEHLSNYNEFRDDVLSRMMKKKKT